MFNRYELMANNVYIGQHKEMDIFALRKSGYCDEIEIKHSVSDFKADFKKRIHVKCEPFTPEPEFIPCNWKQCRFCKGTGEHIDGGKCGYLKKFGERKWIEKTKHEAIANGETYPNYFSFMIPESLVDKVEIPDYAGLYVCTENGPDNGFKRITEVKKAKLLHRDKIGEKNVSRIARKLSIRYWENSSAQPEHNDERRLDMMDKHQKIGEVLRSALSTDHPCMLDWADIGMEIKYGRL